MEVFILILDLVITFIMLFVGCIIFVVVVMDKLRDYLIHIAWISLLLGGLINLSVTMFKVGIYYA